MFLTTPTCINWEYHESLFHSIWNIMKEIKILPGKKNIDNYHWIIFLNLSNNFSLLNNITLCIFSYDFLFDLYWGQGGLRDQFWFLVKFRHVGVRLTFDVDQKLNVVMICEKIEHLWSLRCNIYGVQNITIMKFKIYLRY